MRRALDQALDQILTRPVASLPPPIRNNLRMGAYQILYLSRVPPHAAVNEAVALARKHGSSGMARLTNAVLRELSRRGAAGIRWPEDPVQRIAVQESYPDWLISMWIADHGLEDARLLARAQNQPPPFSLRANQLKISGADLAARLEEAGLSALPSPVVPEGVRLASPGNRTLSTGPDLAGDHPVGEAGPGMAETLDREGFPGEPGDDSGLGFEEAPARGAVSKLPGYAAGWWYVQGEGAMLAARAVSPGPGQLIADVGSAPGGKATHLAELMGDRGRVLAIEPNAARLALIADNARRLGLESVEPILGDGRRLLETLLASGRKGEDALVDAALVDAPCSGLGTLYRKADLRWRARADEIPHLARLQRELLDAAARAIRPGGALVYATCTISRLENAEVVREFLADHPDFAPGDLASRLPEAWRPEAREGMIQLLPHRHGTEGFFIARMERAGT